MTCMGNILIIDFKLVMAKIIIVKMIVINNKFRDNQAK